MLSTSVSLLDINTKIRIEHGRRQYALTFPITNNWPVIVVPLLVGSSPLLAIIHLVKHHIGITCSVGK